MLRNDHDLMIEQGDDGKYASIRLQDRREFPFGTGVWGTWRHTTGSMNSYNGENIVFTSWNPQYYYWDFIGRHTGNIRIGVRSPRGSHRADETEDFQILITLYFARRIANGKFEVASIVRSNNSYRVGAGKLTYNVNPHFTAGNILWSPTRYERE